MLKHITEKIFQGQTLLWKIRISGNFSVFWVVWHFFLVWLISILNYFSACLSLAALVSWKWLWGKNNRCNFHLWIVTFLKKNSKDYFYANILNLWSVPEVLFQDSEQCNTADVPSLLWDPQAGCQAWYSSGSVGLTSSAKKAEDLFPVRTLSWHSNISITGSSSFEAR